VCVRVTSCNGVLVMLVGWWRPAAWRPVAAGVVAAAKRLPPNGSRVCMRPALGVQAAARQRVVYQVP